MKPVGTETMTERVKSEGRVSCIQEAALEAWLAVRWVRGGGVDDFQASDLGMMGEDGLEQKVRRGKKMFAFLLGSYGPSNGETLWAVNI